MPAQNSASYVPRATVCLGAAGARTAVGLTAASSAAAVRAGISNLAEHAFYLDADGEPVRLASDALLPPDMPIERRMSELAVSVLLQLPRLDDLEGNPPRTLLVVCTPEPRPGLPADIAERLARSIAERFPLQSLRVQLLPEGNAAGMVAFGVAAKALDEREADVAVVLGVDSSQDFATIRWLDDTGQLKSARNRDGFFPGEAAGACLLARADVLKALGLAPLARITAVSLATEPITMAKHGEDGICVGEGLSAAFLGLEPVVEADGRRITDAYCDLNGQRYRSEELVYAILRAQKLSVDAGYYLHPADCWGDVGAASAPLFAALSQAAYAKAYSRGARAALWGGSQAGRRAVVLLDFPLRQQRQA
jgi:3-oxoacyl-[acyl-carrier-protein] synthase I